MWPTPWKKQRNFTTRQWAGVGWLFVGFIDMTGSLLPGIDGFSTRMNVGIVSLMRQCTAYAVRFSHNSDHWFGPVLAKHFFD